MTCRICRAVCVFALFIGAVAATPLVASDDGFEALFDGRTLDGWSGDPRFWSVQEGVIVGRTTDQLKTPHNTFLIHQQEPPENFHLVVEFRIAGANNSGIQYRSKLIGDHRVAGYQAEVEDDPTDVGFLYDEAGRGRIVEQGTFTLIEPDDSRRVIGPVFDRDPGIGCTEYRKGDWNHMEILARGDHLVHILNGRVVAECIDRGAGRHSSGLLALQLHAGEPMKVEYRDIRVKRFDDSFTTATLLIADEGLADWAGNNAEQLAAWSNTGRVLATKGQPIGYLRTQADYTSFVMRLQIRHLAAGNSGVLVRMIGPDKVWPRSIEAQGQKDALGDIWNIDEFPMTTAAERTNGRHTRRAAQSNERPLGEWNDYEIRLIGTNLEIYVNGLLQNTATDCLVTPGKIALQSEGTAVEFRNLVVIEALD